MSETKTLHRNFWVWEFEKEERWLNEMAQEGWALQNAGFCTYTFEKTEPGQYIIRLAMLDSSPDFESFMEELEAQSVGHCFSWGYFRRSAQLGPFDMFSDVDSRISHLNKIGQMVRLLCLANLLIGVTNTFGGASLAWLNLLCATFLAYGLGRISSNERVWWKNVSSTSDFFLDVQDLQSFQKIHFYPLAFRCRRVYYCH